MEPESASICFVTREFDPITAGGIGGTVRRLIEQLANSNIECSVLLDTSSALARRVRVFLDSNGFSQVAIFCTDDISDCQIHDYAFRSESYWRSYRIWRSLEEIAKTRDLKLVEFADYEGLAYVALKAKRLGSTKRLTDSRIVIRIHGTGELTAHADEGLRYNPATLHTFAMERYCLCHADFVLTPSTEVLNWYQEHYTIAGETYQGLPPYVHLGDGNSHVQPEETTPVQFLFFGKLQPLKGPEEFVRAGVSCLQHNGIGSALFHIVGPAPKEWDQTVYEGRLKQLIPEDLSSSFKFYGRLDRGEVTIIASRCHAAVFPSRMETFCLAAHELNWLGIPLILSDIPAFRGFFRHMDTALFFDGSARGLEETFETVVKSPDILRQLSWTSADGNDTASRPYRDLLERIDIHSGESSVSLVASSSPQVSCIIPYYNMHEFIDDTLTSIEASVFQDLEIILVDDGSTSSAAKARFSILEEQKSTDPRYRFLRKENGGLGSARNAAIEAARGEFVLPLDSDDLIHPSYLSRAVQALSSNSELGFASCFCAIFADGKATSSAKEWIIPYDPSLALLMYENGSGTASCLFRREVLQNHQYDETMDAYEDWDLHVALARDQIRGEVIPEVLFYYRSRRNSMVHKCAYSKHDILLSYMLDKHFPEISSDMRDAFKLYIEQLSEARGLGTRNSGFTTDAFRSHVAEAVRSFYLRRLKTFLMRRLSERSRQKLIAFVKRLIAGQWN